MTRRQLTDEQWEFIEPYLPIVEYGPYPERLRDQFEGVIWRFRSSAQWREMPSEFGPWATVYGRFRVWRDAGVFSTRQDARELPRRPPPPRLDDLDQRPPEGNYLITTSRRP